MEEGVKTLGEIKRARFRRLNHRNRRNVQRNGVSREWRWRISPQARAADTILHFAWVLENHVRAELSSKTDYGDIRAWIALASRFLLPLPAWTSPPPFVVRHPFDTLSRVERSIRPFRDRAVLFRRMTLSHGRYFGAVSARAARWPFRDLRKRTGWYWRITLYIYILYICVCCTIIKFFYCSKIAESMNYADYILNATYSEYSLFTRPYGCIIRSVDSLWRIEQRVEKGLTGGFINKDYKGP